MLTKIEGLKELKDELEATQKSVKSINADIQNIARPNLSSLTSLAAPDSSSTKPAEAGTSPGADNPPPTTPTPAATEEPTRRDH